MDCRRNNFKTLSFPEDVQAETSADGEVVLPDYCPNIMRIIYSKARAYITAKSSRAGRFYIEGYAEFTIFYTSEDDGSLRSIMHSIPFSHSFESSSTDASFIRVSARITSASARALSPQKLYLRASVSLSIITANEISLDVIDPDNSVSGLWLKKEPSAETCSIVCKGQKPVRITDEIELAPHRCSKILGYDATFTPTEKRMLPGKIIAKAEMNLRIVYSDADTNLPILTEKIIPVSQTVDIAGADDDTICDVCYTLRDCKFEVLESGDKTDISYEAEVCAEVQGLKIRHIDFCSDAFSETNDLKLSSERLNAATCVPLSVHDTARGSVDLGNCNKIHYGSVEALVTSYAYDAEVGGVKVDGEFLCDMIITDNDGDFSCVERAVPFDFFIDMFSAPSAIRFAADISVKNISYSLNDADRAEIKIEYCSQGVLFYGESINVLTSAEISGEKESASRSEIVVYFAESDENVWNIAKKYSVSPQRICAANNISDIVDQSRPLII